MLVQTCQDLQSCVSYFGFFSLLNQSSSSEGLKVTFRFVLRQFKLQCLIWLRLTEKMLLTHRKVRFYFYYPLKYEKTGGLSNIFRGYRNEALA